MSAAYFFLSDNAIIGLYKGQMQHFIDIYHDQKQHQTQ